MKIALLTSLNPRDRRSWSGIIYYIAQALQKYCGEVTYIGPMDAPQEMFVGKVMHRSSQLFLRKNFMYYHGALVAKKYAKIATQRLTEQAFDVIVAPTGVPETAFLKTDIPVVLVQDATFGTLHNYYPVFSNLLGASFHELNTLEAMAIKKASLLIYTSTWAANSAIEDYQADKEKIHIVPFGANFEDPPSREIALARKKSQHCRLLFVGVDWHRKGGDIAVQTLLMLEERGFSAELLICGCTPPSSVVHPNIKIIPPLDKNDSQQYEALKNLFATSDFLLLPTRFDCTPVVFAEAAAFGLPVITADTGGVSEIVKNGENGFVLAYDARGEQYAETIAHLYQDDQRYARLVLSSREAFEQQLNWDVWGTTLKKLMIDVLNRRREDSLLSPPSHTTV